MSQIFSFIAILFVIIAVVLFTYFTTRYMGTKLSYTYSSANIKIIDRLVISPDKMILIVDIAGEVCSLVLTSGAILKLSDIDRDDLIEKDNRSNFNNIFKNKISDIIDNRGNFFTDKINKEETDDKKNN